MIPTLAVLLLAHTLADFVLQTAAMVAAKRQPLTLAKHGAIVLITAAVATGSLSPTLLLLTAAHILIDAAKTFANRRGIRPFLADQAAHAATLIAFARWQPDLFTQSPWPAIAAPIMALTAGAILATRAGGFAVGLLMEPWTAEAPAGLPGGGRIIGQLERGLIFILILTGQSQGVGYLVAAKSVLRFGAVANESKLSEYVIIGTLASVLWAIVVATGISILLSALPPLGIPDLTP